MLHLMNLVVRLRRELSDKSLFSEKTINFFICFLIYSFTGWVAETIYMSIYHGHLVKRGFLMCPMCTVYGIGSMLVVHTLNSIKPHPIMLFLCAAAATSIVELSAGILLSKLASKRLWDYSGNFANFKGYICLRNTIIWGVLSLILVYLIHPVLLRFIVLIQTKSRRIICYSAVIWLCVDISISIYSSLNGVNSLVLLSQLVARGIYFSWIP